MVKVVCYNVDCSNTNIYNKRLCRSCYSKKSYHSNPEKQKKANKKWLGKNPDYYKNYYQTNPEAIKKANKKWLGKNPDYILNREHNDINFRLRIYLGNRIRIAIKKQLGEKAYRTINLLGCSIKQYREYIESQFREGMNWNNIHIDHIIPLSSFDLTKEEEQLKAFNYKNTQPLWPEENWSKGVKC